MLSCRSKCKKNTESKNPRVSKTSNGKTMPLSKYTIFDCKKSRPIKNLKNLQEAKGLLNSLDTKTSLRPLIINHSFIITRPHRDFFINNTAFR